MFASYKGHYFSLLSTAVIPFPTQGHKLGVGMEVMYAISPHISTTANLQRGTWFHN